MISFLKLAGNFDLLSCLVNVDCVITPKNYPSLLGSFGQASREGGGRGCDGSLFVFRQ